jgi:hypothetical protein
VVMLWTRIREVFGSKFRRDTRYPD